MIEQKLPDFLIIPSVLIEDKNVQPLDLIVYGVVYWYTKLKLQKCIASNRLISELLNSHPLSVSRSISNLEKRGYVRVIIDKAEGNIREIVPLISFNVNEAVITQTSKQDSLSPINRTVNSYKQFEQHNNIDIIRKPNNIVERSNKKETYSSIKSLSNGVLQEIADKYEVPVSFVKSKLEDMELWLESKGKRYKNYKAALMNWVKKDALQIRREQHDKSKIFFVNPK